MSSKFCHLHVHTEFSMLDGLGTIKSAPDGSRIGYVEQARLNGDLALAITDHGNLCGLPEFYHECRKQGIEPILGEEFYFVEDVSARVKRGEKNNDADKHHFVALAIGAKGYEVLAELSTAAHSHFYGKPIVDRDVLESLGDDAKHLAVLSGCANSVISKRVLEDDKDGAHREVMWWRETFPNFWMELQHHDTDFDRKLNKGLIRLSKTYDLPWVVTNDPHYVVPEDDCHHDALLAIQTASNLDDPNRFRFDGHGYHLRTRQEMRRAFREYGDKIWKPGARETLKVAELCYTRIPSWENRTWHIPEYPKSRGIPANRLLRRMAVSGLRRRGWDTRPEYVERMEHELEVFKEAKIANFMLITADICRAAPRLGVRLGPGRGSVCGSLVAMLIGIHKVDPIKYNLLFERFLNPARPRMPDIDSDLAQSGRERMFEYVIDLYGDENVLHVAQYAHMKVKAAFQQLARVHGIHWQEAQRISKTLSDDEDDYNLPDSIRQDYPDLAEQLERLAGTKRAVANHPAGVIIASPDVHLRKQVPRMWIPSSKRWVGMYDLEAIEELGLLKEDLLGLKTLDTITWCLKYIEDTTGEVIDPDEWVPDEEPGDAKVYKMLAKGKTAGVFQMEGPTNQRGIKAIKPRNFEDIVSCTSLYRTGAISAGFPKIFLDNRKSGTIEYIHPALEPILGDTWGVVLYQEQVMEMGRSLAGFSMVQVDDIKEAIKHKKSTLMQEMKPLFIEGCMKKTGMSKKQAKECWRYIEGYAGYGYNRSHAVAYTLTTYQTARLRCLYPLQFWAAQLRTVDQSTDTGKEKRDIYCREAVSAGFKLLPADVNESDVGAIPVPAVEGGSGGRIRFGLVDLSGIGEKAAERLLEARAGLPGGRFATVEEVQAASNAKTYRILSESGALECLGVERFSDEDRDVLHRWTFKDPMRKWRRQYETDVVLPEDSEDGEVNLIGQIYAIHRGTTKNGKPYLTWKLRWSTTEAFDVRLWNGTNIHWEYKIGDIVAVAGEWEQKWMNVSVGSARQIRLLHEAEA